uniref:NACHT and WD repeat domain-containing protein 2 n=1 Tax=Diabrotica virgifera virgifera TaxID=50390 RepID=A0A6P7FQL4_DIAVI
MDDRTIDQIFAGSLESLPPVSSKIVRIFTSSTFTDTTMERNTLMAKCYPKIKDYCREKHGLEFQVVDMRWGVRDEATDDHMTTELCMKEIQNCQRLSMGPNFVVFLGQKYGYRPIPTYILTSELLLIRDELAATGHDPTLIDIWYKKDANAVPPISVLQPISSILINFNNKRIPKLQAEDQAKWWDILGKFQKLFRKAAASLNQQGKMDNDATHNYFMSVTEREVINGVLSVKDTKNHCLAYIRYINNINLQNLKKASLFVDIINRSLDTESAKLLGNLRDERLPNKIETSNIQKYNVEWIGREGLDPETHEEYLKHFITHFYKNIVKLVDRAMRKEDSSAQGQIVTEILQHLHACNNSVQVFYGREDSLEHIHHYMLDDSDKCLILYGEGGCGKTSLLAKSASLSTSKDWFQGARPISIVRFLGTTPDSSALTPTLISICQQISYNFMLPFDGIPDDLVPLTAHFKQLLTMATKMQPLLLFLDSVDQLTGTQDANKVSWLPTRLPPNCKIIVSCACEESNAEVSKEYHILRRMIDVDENFIEVKALGEELAMRVIKYVSLFKLSSIRIQIHYFLQHGRILVFHALAYITAAKSGLSESELEDLISLDDKVLDDVYQYHLPPVRRIPPLLWTRIRNDLPNYLSEREADGVNVMNWYHRQFRDTAKERYFKNMNMAFYFHSMIADYFLGIWGGGKPKPFKYTEIQRHRFNLTDKEGVADRKVPVQPLVFYSKDGKVSRYNLRKFGELPFHLVRSRRFKDLYDNVLFNYEWLHAKLSSCPLQAVLVDYEDACAFIEDKESKRELMLVADALRLGGAVLGQYPNMLAPQLIGRLLPEVGHNPNIKMLLNDCDLKGPVHCSLLPLYHCLHTPGGPLKYSLEGHQFAVFSICLTSDYRYVVSVSNRFITWDLSTSDLTRDVNPNIEGIMQHLVLSPDNKWAAAYTNNNQTILLNMLSSEFVTIDNPLLDESAVTGIYLLNHNLYIYGRDTWIKFDMRGTRQDEYRSPLDMSDWSILHMEFDNKEEYRIIFWKDNLDDDRMSLFLHSEGDFEYLEFHSAIVFVKDKSVLYTCTTPDTYLVSKYEKNTESKIWYKVEDLPRTSNDDTEAILQLKLDKHDNILFGTTNNGFVIWDFNEERNYENVVSLSLPYGTRNITTKMSQSNSITLSAHKNYAIAGVRKNLYVWSMESKKLVKVLDAHFGRIIQLEPLTVGNWNSIVTSSIDRTAKVWNINNIFETVHVIDRHELQVDSISLSDNLSLAVTATRNCVGVWDLRVGKLTAKLADSPLGAIVTQAIITPDGKYIMSAESGNILIWLRLTQQVIFKEEQPGIRQLTLVDSGTKIISISKPSNPPGTDCVRTVATVCVREIPNGEMVYSFEYPVRSITGVPFRPAVVTSDNQHLVMSGADKTNRDCIFVYNAQNGTFVHRIPLKMCAIKDVAGLVAMPHKGHLVAVMTTDKGAIIDIRSKKYLRTVPKWGGSITKDGKYGLYAPSRGGLELIELKKGQTFRTFIPKVAEGVFSIICRFNSTDEYVLYYHSGRKTLRVFRTSDAEIVANYRVQAELTAVESTPDGKALVLGTVDGCVSVLAIVDTSKDDMNQYLSEMPSRDEEWKKKVDKMKAQTRFKAVGSIARLSTTFSNEANNNQITENETVNVNDN